VGDVLTYLIVLDWARFVVGGEVVVVRFNWRGAGVCWRGRTGCAGLYDVGAVVVGVDVGNHGTVLVMWRARRRCCCSLYADGGILGGCRGRAVAVHGYVAYGQMDMERWRIIFVEGDEWWEVVGDEGRVESAAVIVQVEHEVFDGIF
jgi:hypothetical protein